MMPRHQVRRHGSDEQTTSVTRRTIVSVAVVMVAALSFNASARQALDRTKMPAPGKTPELRVPAWTKTTLANGAELIVSEKHDLPLVSFSDHLPRRRRTSSSRRSAPGSRASPPR